MREVKQQTQRWMVVWGWNLVLVVAIALLGLGQTASASAGPLSDRLAHFPDWPSKPPTLPAQGDLNYPDWFAGTWTVTTTLVDLVAPLAPEIMTPGFEGNRQYLHQPVTFQARFNQKRSDERAKWLTLPKSAASLVTVADRAFNGFNLATAYLEQASSANANLIQSVKVDPNNPNRQITLLSGARQLVSTVTARSVETPAPDQFITTEVVVQEFLGAAQPYVNEVETTTAYRRATSDTRPDEPAITADQVTAIYLSPQDINYFKAPNRPIALYRYHLGFTQ